MSTTAVTIAGLTVLTVAISVAVTFAFATIAAVRLTYGSVDAVGCNYAGFARAAWRQNLTVWSKQLL